jgi:TolB-like protein/Tfp pilus assembly protein PilF
VAVLPFESMSSDPEDDYFADGMAEELINTLAREEGLRVVARTSAFVFRDQAMDIREIGRRLNVSHVIEGSVRRTRDALRITAQLISTEDGYHVWSERFDRSRGDVFQIQEEIARCVLRRLLRSEEGGKEGLQPSVPTADLSAYESYLRARHAMTRFDPRAVQEAIDDFETAIQQDDQFAPALSGLAEALTVQSIGFSDRPVRETMPRAEEAADRAVELDPRLPEAHLARALARMYRHWDYAGAKQELDRALELNPNFAEAHLWQEFYWTYVEHDREKALASNRRAHRLSPLDHRIQDRFGTVLYIFGEFERAETVYKQALKENPQNPLTHLGLGDTLGRMGRIGEALAHVEEAVRLGGRAHAFLGMLGGLYAARGKKAAAEAILEELETRQRAEYAPAFWVAVVRASLGRVDDAFRSLDRAVEERDSNLLFLFVLPRRLGLHEDPRFDTLMERIGLRHLVPLK